MTRGEARRGSRKNVSVALKSPPDAEGLLTVKEASRRLAVSPSTLYLLMRQGRLPFVRVGGTAASRVEALRVFVEQQRVEPAGKSDARRAIRL
jgi:excisionase family DNA binding protein